MSIISTLAMERSATREASVNNSYFPFSRVVKRFERGGCRTQQGDGIFHFCADDRHVAAVIARSFFLLVTVFLFFVDDDQAEIFEWREDCGTRPDYDASFAIAHAPPFAGASHVAQRGVEDSDTFEVGAEPGAALAAQP